jgi:phosphohistidine swiveling domain-containing protein
VDTEALAAPIPVAVKAPPGYWRREATHCPHPASPFFRVALPVATECYRMMFSEMGVLPETLEYREIGGWIYSGVVPPQSEDWTAPSQRAVEAMRSDLFGTYLDRWPEWRAEFVAGNTALRNVDLASLGDQGLAGPLQAVMQYTLHACEVHWHLQGVSVVTLADLAFTCRDLLGWDDIQALKLLSGLSEASTAPADALARLTTMARERPAVRQFLEGGGDDVSSLPGIDPDFAAAVSEYHDDFGLRAFYYDVSVPSVDETPALTLRLIADQLRSGFDPARRADEVARWRMWACAMARALLTHRSDADRARFERALDRAERWYPIREDMSSITYTDQLGLIRQVAREIGRRLADSAVIDDPDDVFFFEVEEAVGALMARTGEASSDYRDLVKRRQEERAWILDHPGPPTYGDDPSPPALPPDLPAEARFVNEALYWSLERSGHFVPTAHPQTGGPMVTGLPASGGIYTGFVRVLGSEADFDRLQPGDVLVCPITAPPWSVLFPNVGALVTDWGSLLSHPAIIAREFHIPAVVATGNATALLRDGQQVTVDGTAGTVTVLS